MEIGGIHEYMTAKELSDYIFERFMNSFYLTEAQKTVDPKWVRERANNIASGLIGVLIRG